MEIKNKKDLNESKNTIKKSMEGIGCFQSRALFATKELKRK